MWTLEVPILELVARSVIVYLLFLLALRLNGKRELGQFTIFDLALILLAANALQPAITGPDASIPGAIVIVATLFAMNQLIAMLRYRVPVVRRFFEFSVTILARDGTVGPAGPGRRGARR